MSFTRCSNSGWFLSIVSSILTSDSRLIVSASLPGSGTVHGFILPSLLSFHLESLLNRTVISVAFSSTVGTMLRFTTVHFLFFCILLKDYCGKIGGKAPAAVSPAPCPRGVLIIPPYHPCPLHRLVSP